MEHTNTTPDAGQIRDAFERASDAITEKVCAELTKLEKAVMGQPIDQPEAENSHESAVPDHTNTDYYRSVCEAETELADAFDLLGPFPDAQSWEWLTEHLLNVRRQVRAAKRQMEPLETTGGDHA